MVSTRIVNELIAENTQKGTKNKKADLRNAERVKIMERNDGDTRRSATQCEEPQISGTSILQIKKPQKTFGSTIQ